jgi:hypothetical protein
MIVRGRRCGRIPAFRSFEPWSAQGPAGPSFRMLLFHRVGRWKAIEGIRCEAGKHRCRDRDCNVHAKLRPAHFMACGVITVDNQSHRLTLQPRRMSGAHLGHNEAGIFYRQKHPSGLAKTNFLCPAHRHRSSSTKPIGNGPECASAAADIPVRPSASRCARGGLLYRRVCARPGIAVARASGRP